MSAVTLCTAAERPDLAGAALALDELWPRFMLQDPCSALFVRNLDQFVDWTFFIVDPLQPDMLLGRALTVPVAWDVNTELPDRGWEAAIESAVESSLRGETPRTFCALEITLAESAKGKGLSSECVAGLRDIGRRRGMPALFVPVRPTMKAQRPDEAMADSLARRRPDGEVDDPWLRVHTRLGGEIVKVAPFSMSIGGTFEQWHEWTGVDFSLDPSASGAVPGGLVPVMLRHADRIGVYVEPNVWVRHRLVGR